MAMSFSKINETPLSKIGTEIAQAALKLVPTHINFQEYAILDKSKKDLRQKEREIHQARRAQRSRIATILVKEIVESGKGNCFEIAYVCLALAAKYGGLNVAVIEFQLVDNYHEPFLSIDHTAAVISFHPITTENMKQKPGSYLIIDPLAGKNYHPNQLPRLPTQYQSQSTISHDVEFIKPEFVNLIIKYTLVNFSDEKEIPRSVMPFKSRAGGFDDSQIQEASATATADSVSSLTTAGRAPHLNSRL